MILDKILSLRIHVVREFGPILVFLATFLEAIPAAGMFVPGALITFLGGLFAKLGFFSYYSVLILAISGAILGDTAGYFLGRYLGKCSMHKYGKLILLKKEHMDRAGEIMCCHTGKSLIIGRLNPVTRCAAPFIVGAHKISFEKFMLYNVIGGILYGFLFASLGFIFGQRLIVAAALEKWIIISMVVLILAFYIYYIIRLFYKEKSIKKMN